MKTRRKTIKTRNKRRTKQTFKQKITARLMELSLKIEDYVYNNTLIETIEAQQYLDETLAYIPKCANDTRILQVANKIITQMKRIINENKTKEVDDELVTLAKSLSINKTIEDRDELTQTLSKCNTETVTPINLNINSNEIIFTNRINANENNPSESMTINETNEKVIVEEIIDLTQESQSSQSLLKDCDSQVLEMLKAPVVNRTADNYLHNNTPQIPRIYNNTINLINNNSSIINVDVKLANISDKENVSTNNPVNQVKTTQQKEDDKEKNNKTKAVIKIDKNKIFYPIIKKKTRKTNVNINKNIKEKISSNLNETKNTETPPKIQEKQNTFNKPKNNNKTKQVNTFSWFKNIQYVREVSDNEYIETILPETFWRDYSLFPDLADEDFYMP